MSASLFDRVLRCSSCDEHYGPGATVPASDRPGICASCAEALDEQELEAAPAPAASPFTPRRLPTLDLDARIARIERTRPA